MLLYPLSSYAYSHLSPYSYCGGNPVNCVDPTGCVIEGVTKKDAALAVEDFRAMFPGDEFSNFRNLIVQSGKKKMENHLHRYLMTHSQQPSPVSRSTMTNRL